MGVVAHTHASDETRNPRVGSAWLNLGAGRDRVVLWGHLRELQGLFAEWAQWVSLRLEDEWMNDSMPLIKLWPLIGRPCHISLSRNGWISSTLQTALLGYPVCLDNNMPPPNSSVAAALLLQVQPRPQLFSPPAAVEFCSSSCHDQLKESSIVQATDTSFSRRLLTSHFVRPW